MSIYRTAVTGISLIALISCGGGGTASNGTTTTPPTQEPSNIVNEPFSITIDDESTQLSWNYNSIINDAAPSMKVTGSYAGLDADQVIFIGVIPFPDIFEENITINESNSGSTGIFNLILRPMEPLFPDVYTGTFNVIVCADKLCDEPLGDGVYTVPFEVSFTSSSNWFLELEGQVRNDDPFVDGPEFLIQSNQYALSENLHMRVYLPETIRELQLPEQMISNLQVTNITREGFDFLLPNENWGDIHHSYDLSLVSDSSTETLSLILKQDVYPEDFDKSNFYVKPEDISVTVTSNTDRVHEILIYNPLNINLDASVSRDCIFTYRLDVFDGGDDIDPAGFDTLIGDLSGSRIMESDSCEITLSNKGEVLYSFNLTIDHS